MKVDGTMHCTRSGTCVARGGITLLEVVISMGVLAVGVMSIASLLPVGRYQMNQAAVFDHASAVGRAAFRDVQIHGYLRPSTWLYLDTQLRPVTMGPLMTAPPGAGKMGSPPTTLQAFSQTPPAMPLVLDPLMAALNVPPTSGTNFYSATTTTRSAVSTFPYFLQSGGFPSGSPETSAPKIPRITVRDTAITNITPTTIRAIPPAVADRLFRSTDDVGFVVPSANMSLAGALNQQQNTSIEYLSRPNGSSTLNVMRASKGDYTFFVTLSPDFTETWGAPGGYPTGGAPSANAPYSMFQGDASTNRLFNIAVVVCYQRDLRTLTNFTPGTTYDRGERMVWVDFVGRGDVRLRVMGVSQPGQAQQLLDVKPNQWIMVTGQLTNYSPMPPISQNFIGQPWTQTVVKWYRVLSVASQPSQDLSNQTAWYKAARVAGPDWTINGASDGNKLNLVYNDANGFTYADLGNSQMPNPPTGWGTIVTGAVGVYEKTVNLDDSSAFSY